MNFICYNKPTYFSKTTAYTRTLRGGFPIWTSKENTVLFYNELYNELELTYHNYLEEQKYVAYIHHIQEQLKSISDAIRDWYITKIDARNVFEMKRLLYTSTGVLVMGIYDDSLIWKNILNPETWKEYFNDDGTLKQEEDIHTWSSTTVELTDSKLRRNIELLEASLDATSKEIERLKKLEENSKKLKPLFSNDLLSVKVAKMVNTTTEAYGILKGFYHNKQVSISIPRTIHANFHAIKFALLPYALENNTTKAILEIYSSITENSYGPSCSKISYYINIDIRSGNLVFTLTTLEINSEHNQLIQDIFNQISEHYKQEFNW